MKEIGRVTCRPVTWTNLVLIRALRVKAAAGKKLGYDVECLERAVLSLEERKQSGKRRERVIKALADTEIVQIYAYIAR